MKLVIVELRVPPPPLKPVLSRRWDPSIKSEDQTTRGTCPPSAGPLITHGARSANWCQPIGEKIAKKKNRPHFVADPRSMHITAHTNASHLLFSCDDQSPLASFIAAASFFDPLAQTIKSAPNRNLWVRRVSSIIRLSFSFFFKLKLLTALGSRNPINPPANEKKFLFF